VAAALAAPIARCLYAPSEYFQVVTERERVDGAESGDGFERLRRGILWVAVSVFVFTFVGLLTLSATSYWTPQNPWLSLLDRGWRISGVASLTLWAIPYVLGAARRIRQLFG